MKGKNVRDQKSRALLRSERRGRSSRWFEFDQKMQMFSQSLRTLSGEKVYTSAFAALDRQIVPHPSLVLPRNARTALLLAVHGNYERRS